MSDLNSSLLDVSALYNDFCQPLALWGLCLRLVHFAGGPVEEVVVRTLWDNTLLQVGVNSGLITTQCLTAPSKAQLWRDCVVV